MGVERVQRTIIFATISSYLHVEIVSDAGWHPAVHEVGGQRSATGGVSAIHSVSQSKKMQTISHRNCVCAQEFVTWTSQALCCQHVPAEQGRPVFANVDVSLGQVLRGERVGGACGLDSTTSCHLEFYVFQISLKITSIWGFPPTALLAYHFARLYHEPWHSWNRENCDQFSSAGAGHEPALQLWWHWAWPIVFFSSSQSGRVRGQGMVKDRCGLYRFAGWLSERCVLEGKGWNWQLKNVQGSKIVISSFADLCIICDRDTFCDQYVMVSLSRRCRRTSRGFLFAQNDTESHWFVNVFTRCQFHSHARSFATVYATTTCIPGSDAQTTASELVGLNRGPLVWKIIAMVLVLIFIVSECYCLLCYLTASSPSGVTLQGGLRRKPNCFNLLHQMRLLEKVKGAVDEFNEASTSHLFYCRVWIIAIHYFSNSYANYQKIYLPVTGMGDRCFHRGSVPGRESGERCSLQSFSAHRPRDRRQSQFHCCVS